MASREGSNFFGLFGCESTKENDLKLTSKSPKKTEELEEGEIAEPSDFLPDINSQNVHFDTLLSEYDKYILQKMTFKESKKCFICSINMPKYNCPKCGMKTCSLKCCLLHKKDFDCDGVRDRLSFVPLKNYSDQNFNSDCAFINDTCEAIGNSARFLHNNPPKDVSNWTTRFIQEASKRKIRYRKMPTLFKKAKENKSLFIYREKCILWDIEFVLPYCLKDGESTGHDNHFSYTFVKSRISEKTILGDIIKKIITDEESHQQEQERILSTQMVPYGQASNDEIVALFKHDSGRFFYQLDLTKSLLQNFEYKTIVEYPTIYVILHPFLSQYQVENAPNQ